MYFIQCVLVLDVLPDTNVKDLNAIKMSSKHSRLDLKP